MPREAFGMRNILPSGIKGNKWGGEDRGKVRKGEEALDKTSSIENHYFKLSLQHSFLFSSHTESQSINEKAMLSLIIL